MKRSTSTRISYLYSVLLVAGVLANLCVAPAVGFGQDAAQQQDKSGVKPPHSTRDFISNAVNSSQSHALTNAPRAHSHVPASKQKRVRHPAPDFAALPSERFQLSAASVGHRGIDHNRLTFHSSFLVRPRGRAPPVSV